VHGESTSAARRGRTRVLDQLLSERLRREVTAQTDAALMEQFGISYNTWRKVRAGDPIRASVADRLEQRFQ